MDDNGMFAAYEADPLAFVVEVERRARRMRNTVIRDWLASGWRKLIRKPETAKAEHGNRHVAAH